MSENRFFGQKTVNYLKSKSRESLENHTDTSVLYFQIDYARSKKNFYGEMLIKHFTNPKGIKVRGTISITQGAELQVEDVPNKVVLMEFSCYTEELNEQGIKPIIGDYFSSLNRFYYIYDYSLLDASNTMIAPDGKAFLQKFYTVSTDDEQIFPGLFSENNMGTKNQLDGRGQL